MSILRYDEETDSLYVNASSRKAYLSAEISPRISVDFSSSKNVVGIEILDASKVLSELFASKVPKAKLKKLLCSFSEGDALYVDFELENRHARLAIPRAYKSPILASPA